uniref:peptidoglycan DD-metalloendopeptidase family protein n=1 Tax=Stappia sp. TaxID=1870903 RepID=UPI003BAAC9EA
MTGHGDYPSREFGRRKEPHRVIIARGDNVRSFTISPWLAGVGTVCGLALALGYVGATAYLVLRDDIIQASAERQAEMQLSYEDRISSLRSRIDQLTSRRVLEKRSIDEQIEEVVARQRDLDQRQADVARLIARAARTGIRVAAASPLPPAKPEIDAPQLAMDTSASDAPPAIGGTPEPIEISPVLSLRGTKSDYGPAAAAAPTDQRTDLLEDMNATLARMDDETTMALDVIAVTAERDAKTITTAADTLGLKLAGTARGGLGGPFVPLGDVGFDKRLDRASSALERLETVKTAARGIPLAAPLSGAATSSGFGPRLDPFLGRMAMHTGLDFRGATGTTIKAPAPGKVVFAGRNGGYGKSVEIEHPSGVTTRFAHMSRVSVTKGETVGLGETIGYVGSTGRSTGPHLHYEVRINDRPMDPMPFIKAGRKLSPLLRN